MWEAKKQNVSKRCLFLKSHTIILYHSGESKTMARVRIPEVARGQRDGRMNWQNTQNFQANKIVQYDTITMNTCDYTFAETYGICYSSMREPHGKVDIGQ